MKEVVRCSSCHEVVTIESGLQSFSCPSCGSDVLDSWENKMIDEDDERGMMTRDDWEEMSELEMEVSRIDSESGYS